MPQQAKCTRAVETESGRVFVMPDAVVPGSGTSTTAKARAWSAHGTHMVQGGVSDEGEAFETDHNIYNNEDEARARSKVCLHLFISKRIAGSSAGHKKGSPQPSDTFSTRAHDTAIVGGSWHH